MDLNPRESNLEKYLRRRAAEHGWEVIKCGFDGWPDDIVVAEWGVVGWIELKRRGEEPKPRQELRMADLVGRHQLAVFASTKTQVDLFLLRIRERVQERSQERFSSWMGQR